MKYLTALIAFVLLSSCSVQPERIEQFPTLNVQTSAGVGDPVYKYQFHPESTIDYLNAQTHKRGKSISQEILYSGMSNNELNFVYREFADDFARPAFSQEAKYNYEPNGTIKFKGAELLILTANNQEVAFVVKSGFSNEKAK